MSSQTIGPHASSERVSDSNSKELDIYAAEFAKLVDEHPPTRTDTPKAWLGRLPNEAFLYYQRGLATFGADATTPVERRGRLYLIHTTLLFMWMSWGKAAAQKQFQHQLEKGTRRASSVVKLEYYDRADVLTDYQVPNWFYQPVDEWTAVLITDAVQTEQIPDSAMKPKIQEQDVLNCEMTLLSTLRAAGAVPSIHGLSLE